MSRSIRISEETWKAIRLAAAESGERMQVIADARLSDGQSGSRTIRISDEAYGRLKKQSKVEQRTITALVDRWQGIGVETALSVPVAGRVASVPSKELRYDREDA